MHEPEQSWVTATDVWENQHHDWEVMTGQSVLLGLAETGEETFGFTVAVRHREIGRELEGVGEDVIGALEHLNHQIQGQVLD